MPVTSHCSASVTVKGCRGLMADEKFLLVPGLSRNRRSYLLIDAIALARNFAGGEFGIENLRLREFAPTKVIGFGPLPA